MRSNLKNLLKINQHVYLKAPQNQGANLKECKNEAGNQRNDAKSSVFTDSTPISMFKHLIWKLNCLGDSAAV